MHYLLNFFFLVVLLTISIPFELLAQTDYAPDELIIQYSNATKNDFKNDLLLQLDVKHTRKVSGDQVEKWNIEFPVTLSGKLYPNIEELLPALNSIPEILLAEPNHEVAIEMMPNDLYFYSNDWAAYNFGQNSGIVDADIDATEAWDTRNTSPDVKIAILDTGIDWTHPDLIDNIWQNLEEDADGDGSVLEWNGSRWVFDPGDIDGIDGDNNGSGNGYIDDFIGWDFVNNDNNPMDDNGHGTHVAGTIGAKGNNGQGLAGVTWDVQLMALKFIKQDGRGDMGDAIEALAYAKKMDAKIVNNSWGGTSYSQFLYNTMEEAGNEEILYIAAAGNNSLNTDSYNYYPASFDLENIISVGASNRFDEVASFSNFGENTVDLFAPGQWVPGTGPNNTYKFKSGTSMAAPYVAGALALMTAEFPSFDHLELKGILLNTVDQRSNLLGKCQTSGRLNLYNALVVPQLNVDFDFHRLDLEATFNVINPSNVVSYFWDFGDGSTAVGPTTNHSYANGGNYQVCLTASSYMCSDTICKTVNTDLCNGIAADRQVLVDFYTAMGGDTTWTNTWDTSQPVGTWYGVSLDADSCRVTELNLSNNNLSGVVPDLSLLPGLQKLDLSLNYFDFGDLAVNLEANLAIPEFCYANQNLSVEITYNGSLITDVPGGDIANNTYVWVRDGEYYATITGDSSINPLHDGGYNVRQISNSRVTRSDPCQSLFFLGGDATIGLFGPCSNQPVFSIAGQACNSNSITFNIDEAAGGATFEWEIDGVSVSSQSNFTYEFQSPGNYEIKLIASDGQCAWLVTREIGVNNSAANLYLPAETLICEDADIIDPGLLGMATYQWWYDSTLVDSLPTHQVIDADGEYTLVVTDYCGLTSTATTVVTTQEGCIWPGDFNRDGNVNYEDILAYGHSIGNTGPLRPKASMDWEPQATPDWAVTTFGVWNHKHSDANGDGTIDSLDLRILEQNYFKTNNTPLYWNYADSEEEFYSLRPRINGDLSTDSTLCIDFELKSNNGLPIDVYSMGFSYIYGITANNAGGLVNLADLTTRANFTSTAFGTQGIDFASISVDAKGSLQVGITGLNGIDFSIDGTIGTAVVSIQDLPSGDLNTRINQSLIVQSDALEITGEQYQMSAFFNVPSDSSDVEVVSASTNSPVQFYINALPSDCSGGNEAEVFVFSGAPPYAYLWENGSTTALVTNLGEGNHHITVTDNNGDSRIGHIDFGRVENLNVIVQTTDIFGNSPNGTATAILGSGFNGTLAWSNGDVNVLMVSGLAEGTHNLTVTDTGGCFKVISFEINKHGLQLRAKAFLEGPLDPITFLMNDELREFGYLPTQSPYDSIYPQAVTPAVFEVNGDNAIVDWVQVELRDKDFTSLLATIDALIQRDGDIVGLDGYSPLLFEGLPSGYYHVLIGHRNHLPAITTQPIYLRNVLTGIVDFTTGNTGDYQKEIPNLQKALYCGDINSDKDINGADIADFIRENGEFNGYFQADLNQDRSVDGNDRILHSQNNGVNTPVPQ